MWRLCSQMGILSAFVRKKRSKNRMVGPPVRDDLVQRQFTADEADLLWLTDISEHPTAWTPIVPGDTDIPVNAETHATSAGFSKRCAEDYLTARRRWHGYSEPRLQCDTAHRGSTASALDAHHAQTRT